MAWSNSNRRSRLPPDWPRLRAIVLKRDNGVCYLCGQPGADTVDHVVRGDNHDPSNLAAVHDRTPPHCHRAKTARESAAARAQKPKSQRPPVKHPGLL